MLKNKPLYACLIGIYILTLFPLQIFNYVAFLSVQKNLEDDLLFAAASNVAYTRDEIEGIMLNAVTQLEYLLKTEPITRFSLYHSTMRTSEFYLCLSEIMESLQLSCYSSQYLSHLKAYYISADLYIVSEQPQKNAHVGRMDKDERDAFLEASARRLFFEQDGGLIIRYRSLRASSDSDPYLEAYLDMAQIKRALASYDAYSNQVVMLSHPTGEVYCSDDKLEVLGRECASFLEKDGSSAVHTMDFRDERQRYVLTYCYSPLLDCSFIHFVAHESVYAIPDRLQATIIISNILGLALFAWCALYIARLVRRPVLDMLGAIERTGTGDFSGQLAAQYAREFNQLAHHLNRMNQQVQALIDDKYETALRLQRTEFKALQAQINPHFLHNSLFILKQYIYFEDTQNALDLTDHLGKYFQYLSQQGDNPVTLQMEYDHALAYLNIQRMRFGAFFEMDVAPLPPELADIRLPRLTLQPILENSLLYGIPKHEKVARLRLGFLVEGEQLHIILEDNGDQLTDDALKRLQALDLTQPEDHHAVLNTHKRLSLFFGTSCGLSMSRSDMGGLKTTFTILFQR